MIRVEVTDHGAQCPRGFGPFTPTLPTGVVTLGDAGSEVLWGLETDRLVRIEARHQGGTSEHRELCRAVSWLRTRSGQDVRMRFQSRFDACELVVEKTDGASPEVATTCDALAPPASGGEEENAT